MGETLTHRQNFKDMDEAKATGLNTLAQQGTIGPTLRTLEHQRLSFSEIFPGEILDINKYYDTAGDAATEAASSKA